jgi:hypothetical protein
VRKRWAGSCTVPEELDYNPRGTEDDEPGYRFDKHRFAPGEYVSLKEHDGEMRTFRIVSVVDMD